MISTKLAITLKTSYIYSRNFQPAKYKCYTVFFAHAGDRSVYETLTAFNRTAAHTVYTDANAPDATGDNFKRGLAGPPAGGIYEQPVPSNRVSVYETPRSILAKKWSRNRHDFNSICMLRSLYVHVHIYYVYTCIYTSCDTCYVLCYIYVFAIL